jgi:lipopolysaccharide biosynthesis glycosyltransferase
MNGTFSVYIGWDSRENVAYEVCKYSIEKRAKVDIVPLKHRDLRKRELFWRKWSVDNYTGDWRDDVDERPFSTEFSHTRFLVPAIQGYQGWALFMDCDMVVLSDINEILKHAKDKYAVMVVKHNHQPKNKIKMDDRQQYAYRRKNWSSFILFNCAHPANKRLTKHYVNSAKGADLHAFSWLEDKDIGELSFDYNWINGSSPAISSPKVIHYTDGGPWFENCKDVAFADKWIEEFESWQRETDHGYSHVATTRFET